MKLLRAVDYNAAVHVYDCTLLLRPLSKAFRGRGRIDFRVIAPLWCQRMHYRIHLAFRVQSLQAHRRRQTFPELALF